MYYSYSFHPASRELQVFSDKERKHLSQRHILARTTLLAYYLKLKTHFLPRECIENERRFEETIIVIII